MLRVPVERPEFVETTALGAAMLAAVGVGLHSSLDDAAAAMRGAVQQFQPDIAPGAKRRDAWARALAAS